MEETKKYKVLEQVTVGEATYEAGAEVELTPSQAAEYGSNLEEVAAPANEG